MENNEAPVDENTEQPDGAAPEPAAQPTEPNWVTRRLGEIAAARREAEARAAAAEARAAAAEAKLAKPQAEGAAAATGPISAEDFEALVEARVKAKVDAQIQQQLATQKIDAINAEGAKLYGPAFEESINNLTAVGVAGEQFVQVLTGLPKAAAVVTYLGRPENLEEATRIASMPPVHMAIAMAQLESKATRALGKQVSAAPEPIEPEGSGGSARVSGEPDPSDTKAWIEWRRKTKKVR